MWADMSGRGLEARADVSGRGLEARADVSGRGLEVMAEVSGRGLEVRADVSGRGLHARADVSGRVGLRLPLHLPQDLYSEKSCVQFHLRELYLSCDEDVVAKPLTLVQKEFEGVQLGSYPDTNPR